MANTLKFGNGKWATGKDTVLAFNDENDNFKPLPFSFSRASSATVVNQQGLIETVGSGEPRIDFKDNSKGALLLEPSRTNSLLQSNKFDTTWVTNTATIEGGQVGVGNTNDAWLLSRTGTNGRIYQSTTSVGAQTLSVYAKANTNNWLFLVIGGSETAYYDLENGLVGTTSSSNIAKIEQIGNNGWYRCSLKFISINPQVRIQPALADNNVTGSGSIYIQNTQLEAGSYPTSYIPTSGSVVTRVADSCSQTPPDGVIGQTEGTIFLDFVLNSVDGNLDFRFLLSGGNSTNNWIFVGMTNGDIRGYVNNTTNQFDSTFTGVVGTRYKLALAYKQNDFAFYANGIQKSVSTSGTIPSLDRVILGNTATSLNMVVKESVNQAQIYNTRLSNSELQALTS